MARKKDHSSELEAPVEDPGIDTTEFLDPSPPTKVKVEEVPPVPDVKSVVALAVFLKVAGPRWDQMAGFKQYAKRNQLGPMSIPEWRAELQAFMNRPT